jgi:hypothetical protein
LLAAANAEGSYYRYMKAWLATRERKLIRRREAGEGNHAKQDRGSARPAGSLRLLGNTRVPSCVWRWSSIYSRIQWMICALERNNHEQR